MVPVSYLVFRGKTTAYADAQRSDRRMALTSPSMEACASYSILYTLHSILYTLLHICISYQTQRYCRQSGRVCVDECHDALDTVGLIEGTFVLMAKQTIFAILYD